MADVVKYRFARNSQDIPVDVESLDRQVGVSGSFYCYGCGHELIAHLGLKRARHFQHKASESSCARETYLHSLAKSVFVGAFKGHQAAGTPYYLEQRVKGTCTHYEQSLHFTCPHEEIQRHDLTKWFDVCNAETGYKGFVADVLLASTTRQEVLMIEFSVTHDCEPEKIASGARIVEIPIHDEADVAALRDGLLQDGKRSGFRSYNLKNRPTCGPMCGGECPNEVGLFIVYKNGKSFLKDIPAKSAINPQL
ncbi:MAG: competence protein CoiA family protein, partial [Candidatus Saccharimonadales bacterium]